MMGVSCVHSKYGSQVWFETRAQSRSVKHETELADHSIFQQAEWNVLPSFHSVPGFSNDLLHGSHVQMHVKKQILKLVAIEWKIQVEALIKAKGQLYCFLSITRYLSVHSEPHPMTPPVVKKEHWTVRGYVFYRLMYCSLQLYWQVNLITGHKMIFRGKKVSPVNSDTPPPHFFIHCTQVLLHVIKCPIGFLLVQTWSHIEGPMF